MRIIKLLLLTIGILFLTSPAYAARLYSTGFELQSVTSGVEWDTTTNSPTIATAIKRSGAASLRCNPTATTAYIRHTYVSTGSTVDFFFRFYLYITASTDALDTIFLLYDGVSAGWSVASIRLNSDRTLELWDEDCTVSPVQLGSDSNILNLNTWYRIEVAFDYIGIDDNTITAYIDGVQFATGNDVGSGDGVSFGPADQPNIMELGCVTSTTADLYFDDIAINNSSGTTQTGLPGAGSIVHIYPDSAGDIDETLETPNGYANVDEKPTPDDATSYVQFATANDDLLVNCEASSVPGIGASDTITLVQVGVRHVVAEALLANFTPKIESQAAGTLQSGTIFTHNDTTWKTNGDVTPRNYKLTSYVDPQAGGAWTPALLDAMQIGGTCIDATPDFWVSSFWALVEYVPSGAPPPAGHINILQNCHIENATIN